MHHGVQTAIASAHDVKIRSGKVFLHGDLIIPTGAEGVALFAHGSGSSRHSRRNQFVARALHEAGVGTLLFDLLTKEEEAVDTHTRHLRFNIGLLAQRLIDATYWLKGDLSHLNIGFFGASTGGGAALVAAAELRESVGAVVSRGGRPDLAGEEALSQVMCPTLLIVGEFDYPVIEMNQEALTHMRCEKKLQIVPGATHLFEEPGTLEEVAHLAAKWFQTHLHSKVTEAQRRPLSRPTF